MRWSAFAVLLVGSYARSQTICPPTPAYSLCEISLAAEKPVEIQAEFRSPGYRTFLIPGFWDGSKLILRLSPTEAGNWTFRITSNSADWNGKEGSFTATKSAAPGYVEVANVQHFWYGGNHQPHLWMGDIAPPAEGSAFETYAAQRAKQHFTHVRLTLLTAATNLPDPQRPDASYFASIDQKILALNRQGITADLVIAGGDNVFTKWYPDHSQRERVLRYLVARYGAMDITWQGLENFETYENSRELFKEIGSYLTQADQYHHLLSTATEATSAPFLDDHWMKFVLYQSPDMQLVGVEHQLYPAPSVNDFGAGETNAEVFRHKLWQSTMAGAYPESAIPSETAAAQMKIWYDFMATTRHWELQPFFDAEGGTGLAMEDVEYLVYLETAGPVTVQVEKHGYDVEWLNPVNGEVISAKNFKGEVFTGNPPDTKHDWVLHLSREGRKNSLQNSYKFESREVLFQEPESKPEKLPFEIAQPATNTISLRSPGQFAVKLTKETRATRRMQYVWTGEVSADGESYRVLGTGPQGSLQIPSNIARRFPALLHIRVTAMNANGKIYIADRNYDLTQ